MTPFLSKISGTFDGLFGIFFGPQGIAFVNQSFDLGMSKKYKHRGRRRHRGVGEPARHGHQGRGLRRASTATCPLLEGVLNTPHHKKFLDDSTARLKAIDPSGPLPGPLRAVELRGRQRAQGRHAEVGLPRARGHHEAHRGPRGPGDEGERTTSRRATRLLRKEDHQAFVREFIFEIRGGKYKILDVVPKEKTVVPGRLQVRLA